MFRATAIAVLLGISVGLSPAGASAQPVPPGVEHELGRPGARTRVLDDYRYQQDEVERAALDLQRQARDFERHVASRRHLSPLMLDARRLSAAADLVNRDIQRGVPSTRFYRHVDRLQRDYHELRDGLLAERSGLSDLRRWNRVSFSFDRFLMVSQVEPKSSCSLEDTRAYRTEGVPFRDDEYPY